MTYPPAIHELRYHWTGFTVLLIFVLILTFPFWLRPNNLLSTEDVDALTFLALGRVFVDAIWNNHRFPLWNPYFGGGVLLAGAVWNRGLTPFPSA